MLFNPLSPITFLKINSLKTTVFILFVLLLKTNLLRLKGGLIGGLVALILISGLIITSSVALGSIVYALKLKKENNPNKNSQVEDNLETIDL